MLFLGFSLRIFFLKKLGIIISVLEGMVLSFDIFQHDFWGITFHNPFSDLNMYLSRFLQNLFPNMQCNPYHIFENQLLGATKIRCLKSFHLFENPDHFFSKNPTQENYGRYASTPEAIPIALPDICIVFNKKFI